MKHIAQGVILGYLLFGAAYTIGSKTHQDRFADVEQRILTLTHVCERLSSQLTTKEIAELDEALGSTVYAYALCLSSQQPNLQDELELHILIDHLEERIATIAQEYTPYMPHDTARNLVETLGAKSGFSAAIGVAILRILTKITKVIDTGLQKVFIGNDEDLIEAIKTDLTKWKTHHDNEMEEWRGKNGNLEELNTKKLRSTLENLLSISPRKKKDLFKKVETLTGKLSILEERRHEKLKKYIVERTKEADEALDKFFTITEKAKRARSGSVLENFSKSLSDRANTTKNNLRTSGRKVARSLSQRGSLKLPGPLALRDSSTPRLSESAPSQGKIEKIGGGETGVEVIQAKADLLEKLDDLVSDLEVLKGSVGPKSKTTKAIEKHLAGIRKSRNAINGVEIKPFTFSIKTKKSLSEPPSRNT